MFKNKSEATYVMVGRIATVVVVILGMAWIPVMMSLGSLYDYLQGIQSLLAPAMVAVFALGIFSKKITPKAGETAMIVGFLIGMIRLLTNILITGIPAALALSTIAWEASTEPDVTMLTIRRLAEHFPAQKSLKLSFFLLFHIDFFQNAPAPKPHSCI